MPAKAKQTKQTTSSVSKTTSKQLITRPGTTKNSGATDGDRLPWPKISAKKGLTVDCILEDQIYVIDNLLTAAECDKWVEFGQTLEFEAPRPPGKDEAERTNFRFQTYAPKFAQSLYQVITPYLTSEIFNTPSRHVSLYPKIRIYDYPPQTFFAPHYDESTVDPLTNAHSRWTLLVYLTAAPEVGGGSTVFWTRPPNAKGRNGESLAVELRKGRAVLHKHGDECLLHEGERVEVGHKWILRSDVMYASGK